jgi:hypothetical protein
MLFAKALLLFVLATVVSAIPVSTHWPRELKIGGGEHGADRISVGGPQNPGVSTKHRVDELSEQEELATLQARP